MTNSHHHHYYNFCFVLKNESFYTCKAPDLLKVYLQNTTRLIPTPSLCRTGVNTFVSFSETVTFLNKQVFALLHSADESCTEI